MPNRTLELLESIMSGHEMSPDELDSLVTERVKDGLFLDYKHGNILQDHKHAAQMLREYLSGFANSAGGMLIVGVDDQNWVVTGCSAPGGGDLAAWAATCLAPIAYQFSPLPRFHIVRHSNGTVLVASTSRSLNLVYCIEAQQPVYYLRLHDETLAAPDYLVSDLVLGRRQNANLHMDHLALTMASASEGAKTGHYQLSFGLAARVQNLGLAWASQPRLAFVAWTIGTPDGQAISNHLLSYLDVHDVPVVELQDHVFLSHTEITVAELGPFAVGRFDMAWVRLPLRKYTHWYTPYTWLAAVYLMSKHSAPVWYQVSLAIGPSLLQLVGSYTGSQPGQELAVGDLLQFRPMMGERPVVAWDGLKTEPRRE